MATIRGNFKLTSSHKDDIADAAKSLLNRVVKIQERLFPLTTQEVYDGTTSSEDQRAISHLSVNLYYISHSSGVHMRVQGEDISGIGGVRIYTNTIRFPTRTGDHAPDFVLDTLPVDRREAFVEWCNVAFRQYRIAKVASRITGEFIKEHGGDSLASLRMRWPGIMAVLLSMPDPWPERARNLTTIQRSEYGWPRRGYVREDGYYPDEQHPSYTWYLAHMERLPTIDGLLAGGRLLDVPEPDSRLTATVVDWGPGVG
jgi:hypothetical protein